MRTWEYTLLNGKHLRSLINDGDGSEDNIKSILETLIKAYRYIGRHFGDTEEDITYDTQDIQDDIDMQCFDVETVDYHLQDLYDYCDELNVWVGL